MTLSSDISNEHVYLGFYRLRHLLRRSVRLEYLARPLLDDPQVLHHVGLRHALVAQHLFHRRVAPGAGQPNKSFQWRMFPQSRLVDGVHAGRGGGLSTTLFRYGLRKP